MSGDYSRLDDGETTKGTFHRRKWWSRVEPARVNSRQSQGPDARTQRTSVPLLALPLLCGAGSGPGTQGALSPAHSPWV